jgi:hypothetical protein
MSSYVTVVSFNFRPYFNTTVLLANYMNFRPLMLNKKAANCTFCACPIKIITTTTNRTYYYCTTTPPTSHCYPPPSSSSSSCCCIYRRGSCCAPSLLLPLPSLPCWLEQGNDGNDNNISSQQRQSLR